MSFGPRIPNTPGHDKLGDWLLANCVPALTHVVVQDFQWRTARGKRSSCATFLRASGRRRTDRILFLAHWDTGPSPTKVRTSASNACLPRANDGRSGVAVLLGVADALKRSRRPWV